MLSKYSAAQYTPAGPTHEASDSDDDRRRRPCTHFIVLIAQPHQSPQQNQPDLIDERYLPEMRNILEINDIASPSSQIAAK